jgi:hypothetical protein
MRQASIFLVEDEALVRVALAAMVEELGHRVVAEAHTIADAGQYAMTRSMILPFSTSISAATASIRSPTSLKSEDSRFFLLPATERIGFQPCFAGARFCRNRCR